MKKTISIIVAICAFIASLATNVYYIFDNDSSTNPDVSSVIDKGKDVYQSITSEVVESSEAKK